MSELDSAQRRALRARAHHLRPVVSIGHHGLTPEVLHEIDGALRAHELIKVRVFDDDRATRESLMATICRELACEPVQHLGKLLILWRANPEKAPEAGQPSTRARGAAGTAAKGTPRPDARRRRRALAKPTSDGAGSPGRPRVARRARGQPAPAPDERPAVRPPRAARTPRQPAGTPKAPRGGAKPAGGVSAQRSRSATPKPAAAVSTRRASGARGGPSGVPRAPNPRRRRTR